MVNLKNCRMSLARILHFFDKKACQSCLPVPRDDQLTNLAPVSRIVETISVTARLETYRREDFLTLPETKAWATACPPTVRSGLSKPSQSMRRSGVDTHPWSAPRRSTMSNVPKNIIILASMVVNRITNLEEGDDQRDKFQRENAKWTRLH